MSIWMTKAMPLELMYSTLEKSIRTGRLFVTPSYVPSTVSREVLEISPVKRRTVTGFPFAPITSSTLAFVSDCTLLTLLGQPDDQSYVASFARASFDPLRLIHQRLDQKHAHAAGTFFTMHLAVDVRFVGSLGDTGAGIHYVNLQRFIAGGKDPTDAQVAIEAIAAYDGIYACLGKRCFEVFNAIVGEPHELGDTGRRAH